LQVCCKKARLYRAFFISDAFVLAMSVQRASKKPPEGGFFICFFALPLLATP
jgi:hypothetical protein